MTGNEFRKGISGSCCILIAVCLIIGFGLVGTVSATGCSGGGGGGSSEITYPSTALFTNWDEVTPIESSESYVSQVVYEKQITNPTTCISGISVFLPEADKPKPKNIDYLAYAISRYSDKLTKEQYEKLSQAYKGITLTGADPDGLEQDSTYTITKLDTLDDPDKPVDMSTLVEFCTTAQSPDFLSELSSVDILVASWK